MDGKLMVGKLIHRKLVQGRRFFSRKTGTPFCLSLPPSIAKFAACMKAVVRRIRPVDRLLRALLEEIVAQGTAHAVGTAQELHAQQGRMRFVNELERCDVLSRAAPAQPDGVFYRITTVKNAKVDENGITAQGQSIKSFSMAKRVCEAPTIEELAKKVGMDPLVLAKRLRSGITSAVRP